MTRPWADPPILAMMIGQTIIWACTFYSFPALVLHWQRDFGWTSSQVMGAFSLALFIQALAAPSMGHLIDKGRAPLTFPVGALVAAGALIGLTQVTTLPAFYALWAVLGLTMGLTLYDACFALVTRARGADARRAITAITLVAGFASTLSYPLLNAVAAAAGWRSAVWTAVGLVLLINLPLATFGARRLEAEVTVPASPAEKRATRAVSRGIASREGFLPLAIGFGLSALGTAIIISHLLPLLASLGVASTAAVLTASMIGPSQVAGRIAMTVFAPRVAAQKMMLVSILGTGVAAAVLLVTGLVESSIYLFAVLHGMSFGLVSILRPVVIRETLGSIGFGAVQGAVVRPSLLAFAAAPYIGALVADAAGYVAVLALCIAAQIAGALLMTRVRPVV
jgi:MFS family permease